MAQGSLVVDGEKNQFKVKSVFTDSGKLLLAPCDEARKDDVFSITVAQFMDEYKVFDKESASSPTESRTCSKQMAH